jgi:hypothetical protein
MVSQGTGLETNTRIPIPARQLAPGQTRGLPAIRRDRAAEHSSTTRLAARIAEQVRIITEPAEGDNAALGNYCADPISSFVLPKSAQHRAKPFRGSCQVPIIVDHADH